MATRLRRMSLILALPFLSSCVVAAGSSRSGSGSSFLIMILPLAAVLVFLTLVRRARGGSRRARRSGSGDGSGATVNLHVLRAELSVLADDVLRLEPLVALQGEARDDYEAATHRYRVAQTALEYVKEPEDLLRVQRVVDEANWSMGRARAIVAGREPPPPPPSLRDLGPQGEPAVDLDGGQRPMYVDSPASFRLGWFALGGGLLGGLLVGGVGSAWPEDHGGDVGDDDGHRPDDDRRR